MDITNPLRLAVGSHEAGTGQGCAMNVISWENGDTTISDMPACADPMLAKVVQRVNDTICSHRDGDLLCAPCSVQVLDLAHRTVGTNLVVAGWSPGRAARVHVELAVEAAESVLDMTVGGAPRRAVALVRRWLAGDVVTRQELRDAAAYADAAHAAHAADAAYAAAYAAYAAYAYAYADAAAAAAHAAYAHAAYADAAAYGDNVSRLDAAHNLIARFEELTHVQATEVSPETTTAAVNAMMAVMA